MIMIITVVIKKLLCHSVWSISFLSLFFLCFINTWKLLQGFWVCLFSFSNPIWQSRLVEGTPWRPQMTVSFALSRECRFQKGSWRWPEPRTFRSSTWSWILGSPVKGEQKLPSHLELWSPGWHKSKWSWHLPPGIFVKIWWNNVPEVPYIPGKPQGQWERAGHCSFNLHLLCLGTCVYFSNIFLATEKCIEKKTALSRK